MQNTTNSLVQAIRHAYPQAEAIYLFGSWGSPDQRANSDLDIAILLPPDLADSVIPEQWFTLSLELARLAGVDSADLVNLRQVDTVFQYQIVMSGRQIFQAQVAPVEEFELLVMALYQELTIQRADIIKTGIQSSRFFGAL